MYFIQLLKAAVSVVFPSIKKSKILFTRKRKVVKVQSSKEKNIIRREK